MAPQVHILVCTALGIGHFTPTCRIARMLSQITMDNGIEIVVSLFAPCRQWEIESSKVGQYDINRLVYHKVDLSNVDTKNMGGMISEQSHLHQGLKILLEQSAAKNWPPVSLIMHDYFAVYVHEYEELNALRPRKIAISTSHSLPTVVLMDPEFLKSASEKTVYKFPHSSNKWPVEVIQMLVATMNHSEPVIEKFGLDLFKPDLPICLSQDIIPLSNKLISASEDLMSIIWGKRQVIPVGCIENLGVPNSVDNKHPYVNWLDAQSKDSVVYVALGTLYPAPYSELIKLATSLDQLGMKSLWAYKRQLTAGDPDLKEWEELQARLIAKGTTIFAEWVDQKQVLQHDSIRLFATHCGWNSLTENFALKSVPMLCLPLGSEQYINAAWISLELKVGVLGIDLDTEPISNETLKTPRGNVGTRRSVEDQLSTTDVSTDTIVGSERINKEDNKSVDVIMRLIKAGNPRPIKFADVSKLNCLLTQLSTTEYSDYRERASEINAGIAIDCEWTAVQNRLKGMLNTIPEIFGQVMN